MKPEELRIGNYVFPLDQGGEKLDIAHKVTLISRTYVGVTFTTEVNRAYNEIEPIPLTEEWIEKFGFKFQEDESPYGMMLYTNEDWSFCILEEFGTYSYAESQGEDYEYFDVMCLRTVHQLQNLYFALTGEELTINEI